MTLRKIKIKSKSTLVVEQFIEDLLAQKYLPGDRLPVENELAKMFGVSRVTIREAFQKLLLMGVVDIREGCGTFVRKPDVKNYMAPLLSILLLSDRDIGSLYETRLYLETGIASFAARYANAGDIERLEDAHSSMKQHLQKSKYTNEEFHSADKHFHHLLSESTHNEFLILIYKMISDIFESCIKTTYEINQKAYFDEHRQILDTVITGDEHEASIAMQKHIFNPCPF